MFDKGLEMIVGKRPMKFFISQSFMQEVCHEA